MKKVLLLVACMLVVPSLVLASNGCPKYELGFKGDAKACIFGVTFPIVGASVVLTTPENQGISKVTDAAGTYVVKEKVNNCTLPVGFYTQKWSVTINAGALGIPASKTCDASADFICCCEQCVQSIVKTCKLLYAFCCGSII
ncbi:MAG: hypothetical protein WCD80_02520 [Desulfobaccales bacterium]